jgi:hypothetical protein
VCGDDAAQTQTNMNAKQETLYAAAEQLTGYNALALKAMAQWAYDFRKDKEAMRIASGMWGHNARTLAKAYGLFGNEFNRGVSVDETLSLIAMASLPEHEAALLAEQWKSHTLPYWEIRERVDARKKRPSKAQTVKTDKPPMPNTDALDLLARRTNEAVVKEFAVLEIDGEPERVSPALVGFVLMEYFKLLEEYPPK